MSSDTDLHLIFKNAAGKKVILKIENPKAGVTKAEIDAAMQAVVMFFIGYFAFRTPVGVEMLKENQQH